MDPAGQSSIFYLGRGEQVVCNLPYDRAARLWARMYHKRQFFYVRPGMLLNPLTIVMMTNQEPTP